MKEVVNMRTMAITDFKAHALQILAQIAQTKEPVVITKRGKLADALVFEKDIVSPLGEDIWDVCQ